MLSVKEPKEAREIILTNFAVPAKSCILPIDRAAGRVLCEDIYAKEALPPFDRSMVDGYAVRAADTFGCSESIPAMLTNVGEVLMGKAPTMKLEPNQCAYVPTGGQLPEGADGMVMIEYAENMDDGYIYIEKPSAPGAHIAFTGDDVQAGKLVLAKGVKLRPQDIGVLAALGVTQVAVAKPPVVGILSTGDEIIEIDQSPKGAQIRDVNAYALDALVRECGGEPLRLGICPDEYDTLRDKVRQSVCECDILLISGGSSVGTRDSTHRVIEELGGREVLFHGIAIKPGKPTILGRVENKPVFGLPGHPVSAYFVALLFVAPLIRAMLGESEPIAPCVQAVLAANLPSNHGREEYVSVRLDRSQKPYAASPVYGKSGLITMLSQSNGFVRIARDCEGLQAGETVEVELL